MAAVAAIGAAVASISACSEKIVYRDQPAFPPPPAAAGTFLGYQNVNTKQTICGTCHAGHQDAWQGTAHANAWADLQASGGATAACEGCHTVGQNGNRVESKNVGWTATKDKRYTDVQCESCHGPGGGHVENPEVPANRPLASMNVDPTLASTDGCGACHNDSHHPYVEEWGQSPHGAMPFTYEDPAEAASIIGTNLSGCGVRCHTGEGALKLNFGVTTTMLESSKTVTSENASKITCTVCHDPHAKNTDGQLRRPVGSAIVSSDNTSNLCATCHNRNQIPSATSWRGPHSPEAQLVLGTNNVGWRPASMTTETIVGTHGSPEGNPALCATCHVAKMPTGSGATTWNSTGHLFLATPCIDANGHPSAGTCEESARTFKACTGSGCHASETVARSLKTTSELRINSKLVTLKGLLENTTAIPCATFKGAAGQPINVARGARFNYLLAVGHAPWAANDACTDNSGAEPVYYRALPAPVVDPGSAVHNPFLLDALLQASIDAVRAQYYPGTFTRITR